MCLANSLAQRQVNQLGQSETTILLTCTLYAPHAADARIEYMLALPGDEDVVNGNPLVGETNDGVQLQSRSQECS
jgi:D-aminopeptidase